MRLQQKVIIRKGLSLYGLNTVTGDLTVVPFKGKKVAEFHADPGIFYFWALNNKNANRKAGKYVEEANSLSKKIFNAEDIIEKYYKNPPAFNDYTREDAERFKNGDIDE